MNISKLLILILNLFALNIYASDPKEQKKELARTEKKKSTLPLDIPEELKQIISEYTFGWQLDTKIRGHYGIVRSLAYSPDFAKASPGTPDNKHLASMDQDGKVRIWDANNYSMVQMFSGSTTFMGNSIAYSPDNKYFVSQAHIAYPTNVRLARPNIIAIRDAINYKQIYELETPPVSSFAYSHNSKHLASATMKFISIWDVDNKYNPLHKITTHQGLVELAYSSKHLASCSRDSIKIWDVNNNYNLIQTITDVSIPIIYSSNGSYLASSSKDNTIKIWDAENKYNLSNLLVGHKDIVTSLLYSTNNKYLFSASLDKTINIWDVANKYKLLHTLNADSMVTSLALSNDNQYLAAGLSDGTIIVWRYEGID